ncbi:MAG: PAS domain-containing sensor histidine kinase [Alphaproteobacteria bacterium]|nr:PAS domain-containing sensor histidine kinase [Alphaproteobacteria bacterium]
MDSSTTGRLLYTRFRRWARNVGLARKLTAGLAVAALVSGGATYLALTGTNPLGPNPHLVRILLAADVVFLIALFAIVVRGLVKLWLEQRSGAAGSRLHLRIMGLFAGVAAVPAIIMAVFSALFFNLGLETWFSEPISTAVNESVQVAESYIGEHRKTIQGDALSMAADLNRNAAELSRNPALLDSVVNTLGRLRSLSEVMVFDASGQILARSGFAFLMELEKVPDWAMERAINGEVVILTSEYEDRVRALVRLDNLVGVFLYVGRIVEPRVIEHLERTRQAAREYRQLEVARTGLEVTFAVIFSVVALLLLLATVAFGLAIATRLVRPISGMIDAAERVREGDFSARIPVGARDDEMAALARAFNRMTMQLEEQREDLVEANRQLDERRRFTEAVLAGVSAGVVGLNPEGRVDLLNPSALRLLGTGSEQLIGGSLEETVPEMADLLREARERPDRVHQAQLIISREGRLRNLAVVVGAERAEEGVQGYVVTFDDITDLVSAQRTAAWADVARRIAHEIKNPLTPIQLSAERLRRKYLKEISSDPETFNKCTDTIIRQVGDIGRMVDEFSSFARMPAPVFREENVSEIVRQAIFLQQVAHPEIVYDASLPDKPVLIRCDSRQLAQVFTNLLQNAADSIEAKRAEDAHAPAGLVAVAVEPRESVVEISVSDNGRGLPRENRERLTEPYVTTRAKGTGLGLAIVKKIMEEHGGGLVLGDSEIGGARIEIVFPRAGRDEASGREEADRTRVSHGT